MITVPLNGEWEVDVGQGFVPAAVPGCWEQLTASKRISGPVTWRKAFDCPQGERAGRWHLQLDGVSYWCELTMNGTDIGSHEGIWDRFRFDVTDAVRPGSRNEIVLRVEKPGYDPGNRFPFREVLSGFIPDVSCTFGGIWGDVKLVQAGAPVPEYCRVTADLGRGVGTIRLQVPTPADAALGPGRESQRGQLEVRLKLIAAGRTVHESRHRVDVTSPATTIEDEIPLTKLRLWSPPDPFLYDLEAVVKAGAGEARFNKRIGFREVRVDGDRIMLNGEPVYLRGGLHWGYYPDRIMPRPTREEIIAELRGLKELGFNAVKHCLWVPQEEYFALCDEMGFLAWLELPLWLPKVTPELEKRMGREYPRIIAQTAHHPSLMIASLGCELGADVSAAVLERLYRMARAESSGVLVRDNSGSGECYGGLAADFADFSDYHFYADLQNLEPLLDSFTPRWKTTRPWLFGEYADADTWRVVPHDGPWWSRNDPVTNPLSVVKPDFRLHLQEERCAAPGVQRWSEKIGTLSLRHALVHRKLSMEFTRAYPEVGGYVITAIRDVPIATSGLFDDAGKLKFTPREYGSFNADLVLVPRWDLARTWISGDRVLDADRFNQQAGSECALRVVASNYGPALPRGTWSWRAIESPGKAPFAQGSGSIGPALARGTVRELCRISIPTPDVARPTCLVIEAGLEHAGGRAENSWPLFVWPRPLTPPCEVLLADPLGIFEPVREHYRAGDFGARSVGAAGSSLARGPVVVASVFDEPLRNWVANGGRALVVQRGRGFFPHDTVAFWREGVTLFEQHPLTADLPDHPFRELQLFGMATDTSLRWIEPSGPVTAVRPVLTRLDARESIASHYMADLDFGKGRLIVTTLRFEGGMGRQPRSIAGSSAARWFLDRILALLSSE